MYLLFEDKLNSLSNEGTFSGDNRRIQPDVAQSIENFALIPNMEIFFAHTPLVARK